MKALFLLTLNFLFLTNAYADDSKLSLCNGVWTTKSCDNPEKSFEAVNKPERKDTEEKDAEGEIPQGESGELRKEENNAESILDNKNEEKKENTSVQDKKSSDSKKSLEQSNVNIKELMRPLLIRVDQIKTKYKKNFDISKTKFICEAKDLDLEKCRLSIEDDLEKARDYELSLDQAKLEVKQVEQETKIEESSEQNFVTINNVTTQISRDTEVNIDKVDNVNIDNSKKEFSKGRPKAGIIVKHGQGADTLRNK